MAVSVGHNFDDDKGNFTATFESTYEDHLFFKQRSFTRTGGAQFFVSNPANLSGNNPNLPANIPTNDAAFIFSALTGAIDTNLDGLPDMLGNGQPFNLGTNVNNASAIGSSGTPYAEDLQGDFQPMARRALAQIDGAYEFSRYFNFNGEFKYAHIDTKSTATAPFDDIAVLLPDNAFMPANVSAAINANGAGFGLLSEDYQSIRNKEEVKRDTYRLVLDLKGDLPSPIFLGEFKYDLSYVYGQSDIDDINENNRVTDRFFAALDSVIDPATGKATCRSNLFPGTAPPDLSLVFGPGPGNNTFTDIGTFTADQFPATFTPGSDSGCVAFNPFGPTAASKAAIAFATASSHTFGSLMQHVVNGYVSATVPAFEDWGFAGPLAIVAGGEYRKEASATNPDALTQSNDAWVSGIHGVRGTFNVYELFTELSLPVLKDMAFAKELTFDGAARQSHYSTAGDSTSWKFGRIYSPFDGLKLRGTDAVAVRAPNIGELFAPNQALFAFVTDPCDASSVNLGTSFRVANCTAIENALLGPGVYVPGTTTLATGATIPNVVGGNIALKPETARTVTYGLLVQPSDMGLSVSADWYSVKITNAIQALSGQTIANQCVDLATIANPFCALITRTPGGKFPGALSEIRAQQINVASISTSGIDFTLDYATDTADWFNENDGTLNFHLIGNWLDHLTRQSLSNQAPTQGAGALAGGFDGSPAPRWQTNLDVLWKLEKWTVDYNIDWYSHTLRSSIQTFKRLPNVFAKQFLYIPDRFVQGIQVGYDFDGGFNVYGGVDNLFYQKPAIGQNTYPVDPIGRFIYVGVKADVNFDALGL